MDLFLIALIIAAVLVALNYFRKKGGGSIKPKKSRNLRQEAHRQLKLPPDEADKVIERHIDRLKERYPDRSEEWYLGKIIHDLKRDR